MRNVQRTGSIYSRMGIASDRTELLETAGNRPVSHGNGRPRISVWQCGCLRVNRSTDERCGRCGREKR